MSRTRTHYRQVIDGESFDVPHGLWKVACCDCALVHFIIIAKRPGGGYRLRAWRDMRATAAKRRGRKRRAQR